MIKRITLLTLLFFPALIAGAQIMMSIGGKKYDISEIDSISFINIDVPSATTSMDANGEYSIFCEALRRTGLADSLTITDKGKAYEMTSPKDRDGNILYYPKRSDVGWTVFAEKDAVLNAAGINSFDALAQKCREWYGNPDWYDLLKEKGIQVSTGTDYENEWNVVHMFVAYHIVRGRMAVNELVYEKTPEREYSWNYCFGYEPQAYYETMLQGTLLKVWATDTQNDHMNPALWINRYVKNNTLTDQIGTFGSDAMHPLIYSGAQVERTGSIETLNAWVHSINQVLLYDRNARDAQHERMRFTQNQLLPELASAGIMRATPAQVSDWNKGMDGNRIAFPLDYFDNLRCYTDDMVLRYNVMGAWRALESTQLQGWGDFDYAIRLPRVPSGKYELRFIYPPFARAGMIDFYLGNDDNPASMTKVNSLNATLNPLDPEDNKHIGWQEIGWGYGESYENYGIEAEKVMRENGYMYAPASFSRATYNSTTTKLTITDDDPYSAAKKITGNTNCRTERGYGTMTLRYIIGTVDMKQSEDCWLRIKLNNMVYDYMNRSDAGWSLNFIELVPVDMVNNSTYMEDWY